MIILNKPVKYFLSLAVLSAFLFLMTACGTSQKGFKPEHKHKKDCNCSEWSMSGVTDSSSISQE